MEQKKNFRKELLEILNDAENEDELKTFKNAVKSIEPRITALRNNASEKSISSENNKYIPIIKTS